MNGKVIIIFLICILVNGISFSRSLLEIDSLFYTHVDCYGSSTGSISVTLLQPIVFIKKPIGGLVLMDFMQIKR